MFNNVRFLAVTGAWPDSEEALSTALSTFPFTPCGPLAEITSGWEPPVDDGHGRLARRVGGADLLQLRTQSRILPVAAVNEALELRLEEYRERTGEPPTRREKRRLKAETRDNLLPKALLRSDRMRGFFLHAEHILGIEAATPAKIERFVESLRVPLGQVKLDELTHARPCAELLQRIFLGSEPPGISLGRECRMQDPSDSRANVRWSDMDLTGASIRRHVRDGMKLTHLGIEFNGIMTAVLDENGGLSKLKLLGAEAKEVADEEDPLTRFDAEFVLLTGTLRQLLSAIGKALGDES